MTSTTFFIIFIPILGVLLLFINLVLAPHNPYQEKDSAFECGFKSFLGQNRTQFSVSFFIFGLLFLLFDLEILLVYPYSVSGYTNDIYGLIIMMLFFVLLTLGFIFELGKNALTIESKQTTAYDNSESPKPHVFIYVLNKAQDSNSMRHSSFLGGFISYLGKLMKKCKGFFSPSYLRDFSNSTDWYSIFIVIYTIIISLYLILIPFSNYNLLYSLDEIKEPSISVLEEGHQ